jgi:hypothetical protein
VRNPLHVGQFLVLVEEGVEVPLACEVFEPSEGERFCRPVRADAKDVLEVDEVLSEGGEGCERGLGRV